MLRGSSNCTGELLTTIVKIIGDEGGGDVLGMPKREQGGVGTCTIKMHDIHV